MIYNDFMIYNLTYILWVKFISEVYIDLGIPAPFEG